MYRAYITSACIEQSWNAAIFIASAVCLMRQLADESNFCSSVLRTVTIFQKVGLEKGISKGFQFAARTVHACSIYVYRSVLNAQQAFCLNAKRLQILSSLGNPIRC